MVVDWLVESHAAEITSTTADKILTATEKDLVADLGPEVEILEM